MPVGVAGRRLATLLGATALAVSLAACGGSQIDERTATRISVERGTSTTVQLQIPVGGRADEAFGSIDGFRIESTPSDVSSSFVSDLATLPNAARAHRVGRAPLRVRFQLVGSRLDRDRARVGS